MDPVPGLTAAVIRQHASSASLSRGRSYYSEGAVLRAVRRGQGLTAEVEGSHFEPYRVLVTLDAGGVAAAVCTCPYDWGGWCKHIVAVLLHAIERPDEIEERPCLEQVLSGLDPARLRALVLHLVGEQPDLADFIDTYALAAAGAEQPEGDDGEPSGRRTPLDPEAFRRQVRASLHSLGRMRASRAYELVGDVLSQVEDVLRRADAFLQAGDARNALVIVDAVTEEYMEGWLHLDGSSGATGEFFCELAGVWTEALLTADLTAEERRAWAEKLSAWQEQLDDYGVGEALDAPVEAADRGWDDPTLQRVLRGETIDEMPDEAGTEGLIEARLTVLERQGRDQEYLRLAKASGRTERYLTRLAETGHVEEAVEHSLDGLTTSGEALALAKTLREKGAVEEALRVASRGLELDDEWGKGALARWLSEMAAAAGRTGLALEAASIAFRESPSLDDYLAVQALAAERWPDLRAGLLASLLQNASHLHDAQVDIYLHEGLLDDAIIAADASGSDVLVERVADVAAESRPDWVIQACCREAERIIDRKQARAYHYAAEWLRKARDASCAAGRAARWQAYFDALIKRHRRKWSLVPMLEALKGE